jgi:hypothetical protein
MWVFCNAGQYGTTATVYSVGFIQGDKGVWVEGLRVNTLQDAMRTVNYLNGGNGFPYDLKPPAPPETWDERVQRAKREDPDRARGQY